MTNTTAVEASPLLPPDHAGDARAPRLKSSTIGLLGLTTLGAVMMSPALGIYVVWGPIAGIVGSPTALVFVLGLVVSIPTAVSYSLLSRDIPSTGSAFAWVWNAISATGGTWVGLMMAIYYGIAVVIQPITFGLYFNALLNYIGIGGTGLGTWLIGALVATAIVAVLVYRGIEISTESAIVFIAIESLVLFALAITIIVNKAGHGGLTMAPFDPGKVIGGGSALWSAMILGIFAFTGYDVVSTVAEEAKAPRRFLPRATLMALITVGLFWMVCSFALSISTPTSRISALIAQGLTPVTPIAKHYWGWGQIFVIITALTAAVGVYVATAVGASRAVFAMAREGLLPARLAQLHPLRKVPTSATTLVFGGALFGAILVVFMLGNAVDATTWWGDGIGFFALITYIGVNLANIAHFRRRAEFNWFLNLLVPVGGAALCAYLIYKGFFKASIAAGWRLGGSVMLASVLASVLAILYVAWLWRTRRQRFDSDSPELAITPDRGAA